MARAVCLDKAGVAAQGRDARCDVRFADRLQFVSAECFTGVAGSDAAVDDGGFEIVEGGIGFAIGSQPAGEATEETIARAGGIKDALEWIGRAGKEIILLLAKEEAAVLAALHDDKAWPFGLQSAACFHEVGCGRKFFGLSVVDDEEMDALEHFMQALVGDADPEIHRVSGDEVGLHLVKHLHLIVRAHVGGDGHLGLARSRGELRLPLLQHVDAHLVSGAIVHVLVVFARPGEGFTRAAL